MEEAVQVQAQAAAPQTEVPQEKNETLDPRFVHLAKKEKMIRTREQQIKDREAKIQAKEKEMESWTNSESMVKRKIKENPIQALMDEGYQYDQIVNMLLNGVPAKDQTLSKVEQELEMLKTERQKDKEAQTEREKAQREQAKKQIHSEIKVLVDSSEEFEAIKKTDSSEAVLEYIEQTFDEDGTLLTVEEACRDVENHLVEQAKVFTSLKKLLPKEPTEEEAAADGIQFSSKKITAPQVVERQPMEKPKLTTITSAAVTHPQKRLTEKDRIERAKLAFYGKLK